MKKVFVLLFCVITFGFSFGEKDIAKSIKTNLIEGNFIQTKNIVNFPTPLKSFGNFKIANNELFWDTLNPVSMSIKLTKDGIFSLADDETWTKSSKNYDKELFLALMNLDIKTLEKSFSSKISGNENNWKISLFPKTIILKEIFSSIQISGGKYIQTIQINEVSGDETINEFRNIKNVEKN